MNITNRTETSKRKEIDTTIQHTLILCIRVNLGYCLSLNGINNCKKVATSHMQCSCCSLAAAHVLHTCLYRSDRDRFEWNELNTKTTNCRCSTSHLRHHHHKWVVTMRPHYTLVGSVTKQHKQY